MSCHKRTIISESESVIWEILLMELIVNQKWLDEVKLVFSSSISDIQSSPASDNRSSICQLSQK